MESILCGYCFQINHGPLIFTCRNDEDKCSNCKVISRNCVCQSTTNEIHHLSPEQLQLVLNSDNQSVQIGYRNICRTCLMSTDNCHVIWCRFCHGDISDHETPCPGCGFKVVYCMCPEQIGVDADASTQKFIDDHKCIRERISKKVSTLIEHKIPFTWRDIISQKI